MSRGTQLFSVRMRSLATTASSAPPNTCLRVALSASAFAYSSSPTLSSRWRMTS